MHAYQEVMHIELSHQCHKTFIYELITFSETRETIIENFRALKSHWLFLVHKF